MRLRRRSTPYHYCGAKHWACRSAAGPGLEPQFPGPEPGALPLHHPAINSIHLYFLNWIKSMMVFISFFLDMAILFVSLYKLIFFFNKISSTMSKIDWFVLEKESLCVKVLLGLILWYPYRQKELFPFYRTSRDINPFADKFFIYAHGKTTTGRRTSRASMQSSKSRRYRSTMPIHIVRTTNHTSNGLSGHLRGNSCSRAISWAVLMSSREKSMRGSMNITISGRTSRLVISLPMSIIKRL